MKDIQDSIGYLLNVSARLIKRNLDIRLLKFDITTSQWAVLKLLSVEPILTQAQIAERLNSDRATCGSIIDRLEKKEMILKKINVNDRRAFDISLSQKGIELVETLTEHAFESNKQALKGVSESDIKILYKVLRQITENLEEDKYGMENRNL
ncbi:MarR family winged helix-turn-helix transcriptional regulator [Blautia producta]|uniref:MarR family winged helix-turn-helix transcriptional regulator n=1 Tax=Blautia producta TaxID=33035 RepID=UPI0035BE3E9E